MTHAEKLRAGIALLNEARFDEAAQLLADDVVWYPRLAAVDTGALRGRTAVAHAWREQFEMFGGAHSMVWELVSAEPLGGGTLLAEIRITGRGSASGARVEDRFAVLVVFRHGQVARVDTYDGRQEALDALADG